MHHTVALQELGVLKLLPTNFAGNWIQVPRGARVGVQVGLADETLLANLKVKDKRTECFETFILYTFTH